jgi:hypothetical protein
MERLSAGCSRCFLVAAAILMLSSLVALGQMGQTGTINGVVHDPSGAVVPAVKVTVTNMETARSVTVTTNSSGFYVATDLPPGLYSVRAQKQGFESSLHSQIHLDPASTVSINVSLRVGTVATTVSVVASTVNVQTTTSDVSRLVNSTQMEQLPLNGRNFVSLMGLQPGVVQSFTFNSFQAGNEFASQCTQVNGLTGESNNFLIDGTPSTRTRANGALVGTPSADDIAEANIITNGYMPEYSRAAGAQMVITTKSGTDQYHGDVYYFIRNDAFDARQFFSATVPKLNFNDWGYTIGGPVPKLKHKLYFFWAEEWNREVDAITDTNTVPTVADRAGDLTAYCTVFASNCPKVPAYLNGVGGLVAGSPFPGNIIPSTLFSPNGSAMVKNFYLLPNTVTHAGTAYPYEGGLNSVVNYNDIWSLRYDDVKVNFNASPKNSFYISLRQYTKSQNQPFYGGSGGASGILGIGYVFPNKGGTFDWTSTFSPTLLNDFTITAQKDYNNPFPLPGLSGRNGLDRASLGVTYPYLIPAESKDVAGKIPTFIMSGFEQVSGLPYPSFSTGHVYTIQDVLTKIKGNHTLKTGFWWEHDGENDSDQVRVTPGGGVGNNLNGQFEFNAASSNPNTTGSPVADALLGNFDSYSELGYRNDTLWGAHQFGLFGQDSWKVTPKLNIQGGMRWDYFQPYSANWCNWAMFDPLFYSFAPGVQQVVDPTTGFITGGNPYNGIAVPCKALPTGEIGRSALGTKVTAQNLGMINSQLQQYGMLRGLSPQIVNSHWGDFQPRLGFAFDPTGSGKTAIRGSAGIFYNHNTLSDVLLEGGNTPFQLAEEVFNGKADNPGGTTGARLPIPMTGSDLQNDVPVVYEWNLTVQHEFFNNTLVDVAYVGNRGKHFPINADLNQPAIGTFTNPANAGINQDALRPYPGIGGAMTGLQEASSKYDALQVSVQRRFTRGLQFNVNYTYSKTFDMADSIYSVATDTYDPKYNYGLSGFSQTHNFLVTWIYDEPFFKNGSGVLKQTLGGWELSGDLALFSGFPKSIGANGDPLGNGVNNLGGGDNGLGQNVFADVKPGCSTRGNRSIAQFFSTSCFFQPTSSTLYGTAARGIIEGPGLDNWDLALMKNGPIAEKWGHSITYQFRAEFFNILNHPSFTGFDQTVTDSAFGQLNGVVDPREIQFGLKILF